MYPNQTPGGPQYHTPLTYPLSYTPFEPPTAPLPPLKKKSRAWIWLLAILLLVGGSLATLLIVLNSGPSLEDAQSQCLTAFDAEMTERNNSGEESSLVISTITDISVTDSTETSKGFVVYGKAEYEIMGAYIGTTHGSVMLKCTANENISGEFNTTVENR